MFVLILFILVPFILGVLSAHYSKKAALEFEINRQEFRTKMLKQGIRTNMYYCPPHIARYLKEINS